MQSLIAQAVIIPFNSIALAWTLKIIFSDRTSWSLFKPFQQHTSSRHFNSIEDFEVSSFYRVYIALVVLFNIAEIITVIITASKVRKGKNVRWILVAGLTDALTSKENRDPYRI